MKNILLLFVVLWSQFTMAQWYYGDNAAVNLENDIKYDKNNQCIAAGNSNDPTLVAKSCGPGSLYLRTDGSLYLKKDLGLTTNWSQLFELSNSGTLTATSPFTVSNGIGALVHDASITMNAASLSSDGYLSQIDWATFNNKANAFATGSLLSDAPITITNGSGRLVDGDATITMPAATSGQNGYLTNTDWSTFNAKANAFSTGTLTSSGPIVVTGTGSLVNGSADLSLTTYSVSGTSDRLTISGTGTVIGGPLTIDVSTAVLPTFTASDTGKVLTVNDTGTATEWRKNGFVWSTVATHTLTQADHGYVTNNSSKIQLKLPQSCVVGDTIGVVGMGSGGWDIVSNELAATQTMYSGAYVSTSSSYSSIVEYSASNSRDASFIVCNKDDLEWTVANMAGNINSTPASANFFGDASDGDLTVSATTSLSSTTDGDMIYRQYDDLTINAGVTLTTSNRNKGLLLYVNGNLVVNGFLSMTARGANVDPAAAGVTADGLRIVRLKAGSTDSLSNTNLLAGAGTAAVAIENNQSSIAANGKIYTIARSGASGATGVSGLTDGNDGSSGTTGQSGGGGSGGTFQSGATATSGNGAAGTCFSGGPGSGGCSASGGSGDQTSENAGTNGGKGGDAKTYSTSLGAGGGAGNPGGALAGSGGPGEVGEDGTGGLLIIIVKGTVTIGSTGRIEANGKNGGGAEYCCAGGGSGGGNVLLLHAGALTNNGSVTANGGVGRNMTYGDGGDGGAGSVQIDQIDD